MPVCRSPLRRAMDVRVIRRGLQQPARVQKPGAAEMRRSRPASFPQGPGLCSIACHKYTCGIKLLVYSHPASYVRICVYLCVRIYVYLCCCVTYTILILPPQGMIRTSAPRQLVGVLRNKMTHVLMSPYTQEPSCNFSAWVQDNIRNAHQPNCWVKPSPKWRRACHSKSHIYWWRGQVCAGVSWRLTVRFILTTHWKLPRLNWNTHRKKSGSGRGHSEHTTGAEN